LQADAHKSFSAEWSWWNFRSRQRVAGRDCGYFYSSVFRELDIVAANQPALREGESSTVKTYAGGQVSGSSDDADDATHKSEAVGPYRSIARRASVIIERMAGEQAQNKRHNHAVLRGGLHAALLIDLELLGPGRICA
jgi:hypothetical protein